MTSNWCISPTIFLLLPLLIMFLQLLWNGNPWGYLANINIVHCDKWEIRLLYMCIYVGKKVLDGVVLVSTRHLKWWVEPFWHWQYIIGWSSYIMIMTCKTVSLKISHLRFLVKVLSSKYLVRGHDLTLMMPLSLG